MITDDTPVQRAPVAPGCDLSARLLDFLEHRAAPTPTAADPEVAARLREVPVGSLLLHLADVPDPARGGGGEPGRADVARRSGTGPAPRPGRVTGR